jgi:ubiquitin-protein ligase
MTTQKLIDASSRLLKLCDFLEEQRNDSPYSAEAWQELEEENSRLRVELAQIIKIHEELAREYGNFKEYVIKKGYSI